MRLAILSNITIDLLAGLLKPEFDVYIPQGFDTWQQEALSGDSALYQYRPDAAVILLHAGACGDVWQNPQAGTELLDRWKQALAALSARLPHTPLFISSADCGGTDCCCGAERRYHAYFENSLTEYIQQLPGAYVLPVQELAAEMGREAFYAPKMWYFGAMPYSLKAMQALAALIRRYVSALQKRNKKCLAVDLDNTLWGGVIGEDGVDNIILSDHLEGAIYKDTQRLLKKMREQGVILAILSRNNPEDAQAAFSHPNMILKEEDFAAQYIDWHDKTDNIRKLARELNIGLDSIVFLDDNPAEREHMKTACPEVTVLDFPRDASKLPQTVAQAYNDYFFTLEVTGEDRCKTEMYRARAKTLAERSSSASAEDYLKRLEMTIAVHPIREDEIKRVTQLANKTNQFNVAGRRYTESEIRGLAADSSADIFTVRLADKYGDLGLIAAIILRYEENSAQIEQFFMSCRAMGRRAEHELMAFLKKYLTDKGTAHIRAAYVRTAKNSPVSDLFDRLGFSVTAEEGGSPTSQKEYAADTAALPDTTGLYQYVS